MVDKLVEDCAENVEEVKLAKITLTKTENKHKCSSCTLCYFQWFLHSKLESVAIFFLFISS